MDLATLKAAGAFVDPAPVQRSVTWNGHTFDVWIRRFSAYELRKAVKDFQAQNGGGFDDDAQEALLIHLHVLLGEKKEQFPFEDAKNLDPILMQALKQSFEGIEQVPKALPPKTKSGVK